MNHRFRGHFVAKRCRGQRVTGPGKQLNCGECRNCAQFAVMNYAHIQSAIESPHFSEKFLWVLTRRSEPLDAGRGQQNDYGRDRYLKPFLPGASGDPCHQRWPGLRNRALWFMNISWPFSARAFVHDEMLVSLSCQCNRPGLTVKHLSHVQERRHEGEGNLV